MASILASGSTTLTLLSMEQHLRSQFGGSKCLLQTSQNRMLIHGQSIPFLIYIPIKGLQMREDALLAVHPKNLTTIHMSLDIFYLGIRTNFVKGKLPRFYPNIRGNHQCIMRLADCRLCNPPKHSTGRDCRCCRTAAPSNLSQLRVVARNSLEHDQGPHRLEKQQRSPDHPSNDIACCAPSFDVGLVLHRWHFCCGSRKQNLHGCWGPPDA